MMQYGCYGAVLEINALYKCLISDDKIIKNKDYRVLEIFSTPLTKKDNWRGYQFRIELSHNAKLIVNPSNFEEGTRLINRLIREKQLENKDGVNL